MYLNYKPIFPISTIAKTFEKNTYCVNDILNEDVIAYVDNTAVILIASTWQEAQKNINNNLNTIANWLAFHKISLNTLEIFSCVWAITWIV